MLFFSFEYIFLFLPLVVIGYFWLCGRRLTLVAQGWLVAASLFFYAWWEVRYLPVILASVAFNWGLAAAILRADGARRRILLGLGIGANIAFLGYFKYTDFLIREGNRLFGADLPALGLVLPLAISFFTFQQIAFLVDTHKGLVRERRFLDYCLFVTFFPQLISGPIVHHGEMMPQFAARRNMVANYRNIARGLFIFTLGLFKKVVIADTFAVWAINGFDQAEQLGAAAAWVTSLSYSLQLYFDFSGYMDMALGAALMFNIKLPINFFSPYKALSIQDFWRRWHVTLGRFLRDYLYLPLGGNRLSRRRTYANLLVTFVLGGLWHGAGWTFIFWGVLHGAAAGVQRAWQGTGLKLPTWLAWLITFQFVNLAWVFFRAETWDDALKVLSGMAGMGTAGTEPALASIGADLWTVALIALGLLVSVFAPNSHQLADRFRPSLAGGLALGTALGALAIYVVIDANRVTQFIYFGF